MPIWNLHDICQQTSFGLTVLDYLHVGIATLLNIHYTERGNLRRINFWWLFTIKQNSLGCLNPIWGLRIFGILSLRILQSLYITTHDKPYWWELFNWSPVTNKTVHLERISTRRFRILVAGFAKITDFCYKFKLRIIQRLISVFECFWNLGTSLACTEHGNIPSTEHVWACADMLTVKYWLKFIPSLTNQPRGNTTLPNWWQPLSVLELNAIIDPFYSWAQCLDEEKN